ncbi:MAG: DegV family protein [Oscillospiraceae bacterium]|nr:DegV family protein [Oscillospiraceae bacterium]
MSDFSIVADSACDLTPEILKEFDIRIVPLNARIGDEEYVDYPDERGIAPDALCEKLRSGLPAQTSAPSLDLFTETFEEILKEGRDILYIGFASTLSATFSTGAAAAAMLAERYPDRRIITIDSYSASLGIGLLIYLTAVRKREGAGLEETAKYVEDMKFRINHWFTVADLKYLRRGGRLSYAKATIGIALHIKPVLHMDDDGHLTPVSKVRGRARSLETISDKVAAMAVEPEKQTVFICQCGCADEAAEVAARIKETAGVRNVIIGPIGPVISSHTGPGTMGIFFVGEHR